MEFKKIPVKDVGEKSESSYEFIVKKQIVEAYVFFAKIAY